jgi:thiamine biosynthesis lipoprotein
VEFVMGTAVTLDIADPLPAARLERLTQETFEWLRDVDRRFSTFRPNSEVSRITQGQLAPADASPAVRAVLSACADLWRHTDGYFDIWATGQFDPSGYVKGWAVQIASDELRRHGAVNHCLNAGGDVRVRGESAPGRAWRVGVRHPWDAASTCCVLAGTDLAVATSGVYERGPHVVDPLTGEPARGLRSVTVVGADLGVADAYATAALAMGERGRAWLGTLTDHTSAVVTDAGRFFRSDGLPSVQGDPTGAVGTDRRP